MPRAANRKQCVTQCSALVSLSSHTVVLGTSGPSRAAAHQVEPVLAALPNDVTFKQLTFHRTARIICDGTVYIKNERPPQYAAWKEVHEIATASFYLEGDSVNIQM